MKEANRHDLGPTGKRQGDKLRKEDKTLLLSNSCRTVHFAGPDNPFSCRLKILSPKPQKDKPPQRNGGEKHCLSGCSLTRITSKSEGPTIDCCVPLVSAGCSSKLRRISRWLVHVTFVQVSVVVSFLLSLFPENSRHATP